MRNLTCVQMSFNSIK